MSVQYAMAIDLRKCVGCQACTVACKMENDVVRGNWRTNVWENDYGEYPQVSRVNIPVLCNHCTEAPCEKVCPVGATFHSEDGVVLVDKEKCIGCSYCISACPYDARFFDKRTEKVDKCTYCYHRVEAGLMPACISTCITHARLFGDINDPDSVISKYLERNNALQVSGTNMYYILPEDIDLSLIPKGLEKSGLINLWKNIIHPAGKIIMGVSAAAVGAGIVLNTVKGGKNDES